MMLAPFLLYILARTSPWPRDQYHKWYHTFLTKIADVTAVRTEHLNNSFILGLEMMMNKI